MVPLSIAAPVTWPGVVCGTIDGEHSCRIDVNLTFEGSTADLATVNNNFTTDGTGDVNRDGAGNLHIGASDYSNEVHRLWNCSQYDTYYEWDMRIVNINTGYSIIATESLNASGTGTAEIILLRDHAGVIVLRAGTTNYCSGYAPVDSAWYHYRYHCDPNGTVEIFRDDSQQCLADVVDQYIDGTHLQFAYDSGMVGTDVDIDNVSMGNATRYFAGEVSVADTTDPTFGDNTINNSAPRQNDTINLGIPITDDINLSTFVFMWDNGTGVWINNTPVLFDGVTTGNGSTNKTIEQEKGIIIIYRWFANDTSGNEAYSSNFSFQVAGSDPPNISVNPHNFFADDNTTVIGISAAQSAIINLTFYDDIDVYGMEFFILDPDNKNILSLINETFNGTVFNFSTVVDVAGKEGIFTANATIWDSHTAKVIPDYRIKKGLNYIEFDGTIRIEAEGAIWASTEKHIDSYDFKFNYVPFFAPKQKVFYVESDNEMVFIRTSGYTGHFVDFVSKKWIDFEGVGENPVIEKISDKRYKLTFQHEGSSIKFKSIGGLNIFTQQFSFYVINATVNWQNPSTTSNTFFNNTISVSLNVTSRGVNQTTFFLYNSTFDLVSSFIYNATADNSQKIEYFFNHTFSGVQDDQTWYVNATHIDIFGNSKKSLMLTYNQIVLSNCSTGIAVANFTFKDEINQSILEGDADATFIYNLGEGVDKTTTINVEDTTNFSVCIFPLGAEVNVNFSIQYSATTYPERRFEKDNDVFNNLTQLIDLYLLKDSVGIYVRFRVVDIVNLPLVGVNIRAQTIIGGSLRTVEQETTDDSGLATFFVNPDSDYIFTVVKSGFLTKTFTLRPTTSEIITITLGTSADDQVDSYDSGLIVDLQPKGVLNNGTQYNFTFNVTSSEWEITGCWLFLSNQSTKLAESILSWTADACYINITFNTGNHSRINMRGVVELNNTVNQTYTVFFPVKYTYEGEFSLKNLIDDISNFTSSGFNSFTRMLFALIIIVGLTAFMANKYTTFRDTESIIYLTWAMVLFFSYAGWLTMAFDSIPEIAGLPTGWLKQYIILILYSLLSAAFIYDKSR